MDIYTLAVYSSALAAIVAIALLLTKRYMFVGSAEGVNFIGYAVLLIGLSIIPLSLGFTQSSTNVVFFSNCIYTIACCLLLVGVATLREASKVLPIISIAMTLFAISYLIYTTIYSPSVNSRIETRSIFSLVICILAIYANHSGKVDDNEKAKLLLNLILIMNASYMALRTFKIHSGDLISNYYSISDLHKLSFVVTTITIVSLAFSVFWILTARLLQQTHQSSITDELTGLYNRKGLRELIPNLFQQGRDRHFSILLIDLDCFKEINDTLGHEQGDKVIKHFSQVLQSICRSDDASIRYGGDEFLVILPLTNEQTALEIAGRIRTHTKQYSCESYISGGYTVSIGVTQALAHDDWEALLYRADLALYDAKSGGRDCIAQR